MRFGFLTVFVFLIFTVSAAAQAKAPRTVTDFYALLPDYREQSLAERRANIAVEDVANGYLKLKRNEKQDEDEYTEIAIFKKNAGGYVVAVNFLECGVVGCASTPRFFERRSERWMEVSNQVFPLTREDERAVYRHKKTAAHRDYDSGWFLPILAELPRVGRTIRARYTGDGKDKEFLVYSMTWNGSVFASDEPLPTKIKPPVIVSKQTLGRAEAAWKSFIERLKTAVKARDRRTMRSLMSPNFAYSCCDEPYPGPAGAFKVWDGWHQKDYQGWKDLLRELRESEVCDTFDEEALVLRRFVGRASFEFANDRWKFASYGADET